MEIRNKTFLISGGSSGLGAACVRRLAGLGANAIIMDVNSADGEQLATTSPNIRFQKTDVTSEIDVQAAVDYSLHEFGELDGVINCAGVLMPGKVTGRRGVHSLERFAKVININLVGCFNVIRLAADAMLRQTANEHGERGVIINTASVAAFDGQIGQAAYSASKGGIVGMTLPIARELARHGIRVMTIAPGIFETPMLAGLPEDILQSLGAQVPFPSRLGKPDEFAALAQHIVENSMLNGEVIRLDGAIRMAPR